jgi:hypothetical protein
LQSCTKCKRCDVSNVYEPLDPSVQTFFDNMRQGDTLVFQDQYGNYDTAFYGAKTETWDCENCTSYNDAGRTECCTKKYNRLIKTEINFSKNPSDKPNGLKSNCRNTVYTFGQDRDIILGYRANLMNTKEVNFNNKILTGYFYSVENLLRDTTLILTKEIGLYSYEYVNSANQIIKCKRVK